MFEKTLQTGSRGASLDNSFIGDLAYPTIWRRALSTDEVLTLYNLSHPGLVRTDPTLATDLVASYEPSSSSAKSPLKAMLI